MASPDIVATMWLKYKSEVAAGLKADAAAVSQANAVIKATSAASSESAVATRAAKQELTGLGEAGRVAAQQFGGVNNSLLLTKGNVLLLAAALAGMSAKGGADWQRTLIETRNNTTQTNEQFNQMRSIIEKLGTESPAKLDDLAAAYRRISDIGYQGADANLVLTAAMKSAVSTGASVEDVANTLASTMHAFGASASEASHYIDVLHLAGNLGNLTLEQMAQVFGSVASYASAIGVPFQDVAAAIATMTRNGMDAAVAGTQVKDALVHILNPSHQATQEILALSKATGIDLVGDFSQAGLQGKGLFGVMDDIKRATGGNVTEMAKLIPNMRGLLAELVLTGKGAKDYAVILNELNHAHGQTDAAFKRSQQTIDFWLGTVENKATLASVAVGQDLAPALQGLADDLAPVLTGISTFAKDNQDLVDALSKSGGKLAEFLIAWKALRIVGLDSLLTSVAGAIGLVGTNALAATPGLVAFDAAEAGAGVGGVSGLLKAGGPAPYGAGAGALSAGVLRASLLSGGALAYGAYEENQQRQTVQYNASLTEQGRLLSLVKSGVDAKTAAELSHAESLKKVLATGQEAQYSMSLYDQFLVTQIPHLQAVAAAEREHTAAILDKAKATEAYYAAGGGNTTAGTSGPKGSSLQKPGDEYSGVQKQLSDAQYQVVQDMIHHSASLKADTQKLDESRKTADQWDKDLAALGAKHRTLATQVDQFATEYAAAQKRQKSAEDEAALEVVRFGHVLPDTAQKLTIANGQVKSFGDALALVKPHLESYGKQLDAASLKLQTDAKNAIGKLVLDERKNASPSTIQRDKVKVDETQRRLNEFNGQVTNATAGAKSFADTLTAEQKKLQDALSNAEAKLTLDRRSGASAGTIAEDQSHITAARSALDSFTKTVTQSDAVGTDATKTFDQLTQKLKDLESRDLQRLETDILSNSAGYRAHLNAVVEDTLALKRRTDAENKAALAVALRTGDYKTAASLKQQTAQTPEDQAIAKFELDFVASGGRWTKEVQADEQAIKKHRGDVELWSKATAEATKLAKPAPKPQTYSQQQQAAQKRATAALEAYEQGIRNHLPAAELELLKQKSIAAQSQLDSFTSADTKATKSLADLMGSAVDVASAFRDIRATVADWETYVKGQINNKFWTSDGVKGPKFGSLGGIGAGDSSLFANNTGDSTSARAGGVNVPGIGRLGGISIGDLPGIATNTRVSNDQKAEELLTSQLQELQHQSQMISLDQSIDADTRDVMRASLQVQMDLKQQAIDQYKLDELIAKGASPEQIAAAKQTVQNDTNKTGEDGVAYTNAVAKQQLDATLTGYRVQEQGINKQIQELQHQSQMIGLDTTLTQGQRDLQQAQLQEQIDSKQLDLEQVKLLELIATKAPPDQIAAENNTISGLKDKSAEDDKRVANAQQEIANEKLTELVAEETASNDRQSILLQHASSMLDFDTSLSQGQRDLAKAQLQEQIDGNKTATDELKVQELIAQNAPTSAIMQAQNQILSDSLAEETDQAQEMKAMKEILAEGFQIQEALNGQVDAGIQHQIRMIDLNTSLSQGQKDLAKAQLQLESDNLAVNTATLKLQEIQASGGSQADLIRAQTDIMNASYKVQEDSFSLQQMQYNAQLDANNTATLEALVKTLEGLVRQVYLPTNARRYVGAGSNLNSVYGGFAMTAQTNGAGGR